jgi:glycosyltransferase involved in cell wall biosynthesis
MKILWFVDILFDTAFDKCTWLETVGYLQRKNEVQIVTRYKQRKAQFKELNSSLVYIESSKVPFLNRFTTYRNQVRKFEGFFKDVRHDILLFDTNNFYLLKKAYELRKKYGYRTVLDVRTIPVNPLKLRNAVEKYFFRKSVRFAAEKFNGITYITEEMERHCMKKWSLPEHRSMVWTSGVNTHKFIPRRNKHRKGIFTLMYHGNVTKNRGLDNLIRALYILQPDDMKVLMLGSGQGLSYVKRLVSMFRLDDKVIFHAPVPYEKVAAYINQADAGVLPFPDWEGWNTSSPLKLFEYLACGRPVVATKIPAHWNMLQGKPFVFWAEESTPEELAEAIKKAYKARNQYKKLGEKAREFIKHKYTWDIQAEKLERFLKELKSE